jgi:hypothetical protein
LSANDSSGMMTLHALDTCASISRCSCPFRLFYSLKDTGIEGKKIVYIGTVHSELNSPCTLTISEYGYLAK